MEPLLDSRGLTEQEAITRYRSKNYPKPALTTDILVFSKTEPFPQILLIRRKGHPFLGRLALPGGFASEMEPIEGTAARELEEETGVSGFSMKLIGVYSAPGRDPRGWIVSVAFAAVAEPSQLRIQAGDDASEAGWYAIEIQEDQLLLHRNGSTVEASALAFDHEKILKDAIATILEAK